jgi:hypothetical protein
MNPFARLRIVRVILACGVALRALFWATVSALSVVFAAIVVDSFAPLHVGTRTLLLVIALVTGVVIVASLLWRDRRVTSLRHVALWIEERDTALHFALASAVETGDDRLVASRDTSRWSTAAVRRCVRAVSVPFLIAAAVTAVLVALPGGAVARIRTPHPGDALERTTRRGSGASRLTPLVARIISPAYTGRADSIIDEPTDVRTLVGSTLVIQGIGDARTVVAIDRTDTIRPRAEENRWTLSLPVTPRAASVRLVDRGFHRLIAVEPIADEPPVVTLTAPTHDSVFREARGRVTLSADVVDDFGIASAAFEYIVSSGEGETFTFRSGTLGAVRAGGRRSTLRTSFQLDSLGLKPGDIVHVRAVARDANDVSGPGVGESETRALRIARAGEYDSIAVDAAAPSDADKSVISERMLIELAQALERRRPLLARDTVIGESRAIAADQKRLRRSVGDVVFTRLGGEPTGEEHAGDDSRSRAKTMQELIARADSATNRSTDPIDFEGGESPVVATNKPLLEAYNAMWDAGTELELGEPGRALPHMRRALAAIERARQAERLYLRGRPPQVVIDLEKVRLRGKDKGASSVRLPRTGADSMRASLETRLVRAAELARRDSGASLDSLLVLRIDALTSAPAFAAAIGDAATAMRRNDGTAATLALTRARRALDGVAVVRDSLSRWGLVP